MENQNLNILDEVNKGATMGMELMIYTQIIVIKSHTKQML